MHQCRGLFVATHAVNNVRNDADCAANIRQQ